MIHFETVLTRILNLRLPAYFRRERRFSVFESDYIWHAGEVQAAWFCRVLGRRVRGSESGFKSKNKQGNRDSRVYLLFTEPFFPTEGSGPLQGNTNNFGKYEAVDYVAQNRFRFYTHSLSPSCVLFFPVGALMNLCPGVTPGRHH